MRGHLTLRLTASGGTGKDTHIIAPFLERVRSSQSGAVPFRNSEGSWRAILSTLPKFRNLSVLINE